MSYILFSQAQLDILAKSSKNLPSELTICKRDGSSNISFRKEHLCIVQDNLVFLELRNVDIETDIIEPLLAHLSRLKRLAKLKILNCEVGARVGWIPLTIFSTVPLVLCFSIVAFLDYDLRLLARSLQTCNQINDLEFENCKTDKCKSSSVCFLV